MTNSKTALAKLTPTFSVLHETPLTAAVEDRLNFQILANDLADRVCKHYINQNDKQIEASSIDTFGIFGSWGSGKTSILNLVKEKCGTKVVWIDFDALKYQTEEAVLVPLLHHLASHCNPQDAARFFSGLVNSLATFVTDVVVATSGTKIKDEVATLLKNIRGIPENEPAIASKLPESRARIIETKFREVISFIRKAHTDRVVIAIDNLDRCRPAALLELLEAVHLLLNTNNVTFIMALDQPACIRCIRKQYGFSASESALYLEKMIPDYFRVPDPWVNKKYKGKPKNSSDAILTYLNKLLNDYRCAGIIDRERELWEVIGSATILRNPRRIKRVIRRLSSFNKDWWKEHKDNFRAVLFLCVLSDIWPELYTAIPVTEPSDWQRFISTAMQNRKSKTALDDLVDAQFYEFSLAIIPKNDISIEDYDHISELQAEMGQLGI